MQASLQTARSSTVSLPAAGDSPIRGERRTHSATPIALVSPALLAARETTGRLQFRLESTQA